MLRWLQDQFYHFNVLTLLSVILVVGISNALAKMNTFREIDNLSAEMYKIGDEIKDTVRDICGGNG